MLPAIGTLNSITHPLVASLYTRKDYSAHEKPENVLIINASFPELNDEEHTTYDSYLMDLLADLENLKNEAESKVGKLDRVDIHIQ